MMQKYLIPIQLIHFCFDIYEKVKYDLLIKYIHTYMSKKISSTSQLLVLLALGIFLWLMPHPSGLDQVGWNLLIIFFVTIIAIIMNPLPMGVVMLLSLSIAILSNTITLEQALSGFSSHIVWLVVIAFFIARAVIKSNLGKRIAYLLIYKLGNSLIGLSFGLVFTEFLLAPAIPSAIARSGGIIFPIVKSISNQFSVIDEASKNAKKIKEFLLQVCFQANVISSAMFLTAMAGNPLMAKIAHNLGVEIHWGTWAIGSIVPGMINLLVMPIMLYYYIRPKIESTRHISVLAKNALQDMGPITRDEVIVIITFIGLILLWIFGRILNISPTTTALLGFLVLILTDVINWEDAISEKEAWKIFVWYASFITLSEYLSTYGIISWMGTEISNVFANQNPAIAIPIIAVIFFYMHYFFASITVYASVMYSTFFLMLTAIQVQPFMAAMLLAFFANLSGCLTHYGISSAPIFFAESHTTTKRWWSIGLAVSILNIAIWSSVGGIWWKILGWW